MMHASRPRESGNVLGEGHGSSASLSKEAGPSERGAAPTLRAGETVSANAGLGEGRQQGVRHWDPLGGQCPSGLECGSEGRPIMPCYRWTSRSMGSPWTCT